MSVGTRSLLFGVHAFWWHPILVLRAWFTLYGRPTWREFLCIVIHDWGYWGSTKMDDEGGQYHPIRSARWVERLRIGRRGGYYWRLVAWHSRHLCREHGQEPSRLCWPDKLQLIYDPTWFYLLRARLAGELAEYRDNARGHFPPAGSDAAWLEWLKERFRRSALERRSDLLIEPKKSEGT